MSSEDFKVHGVGFFLEWGRFEKVGIYGHFDIKFELRVGFPSQVRMQGSGHINPDRSAHCGVWATSKHEGEDYPYLELSEELKQAIDKRFQAKVAKFTEHWQW